MLPRYIVIGLVGWLTVQAPTLAVDPPLVESASSSPASEAAEIYIGSQATAAATYKLTTNRERVKLSGLPAAAAESGALTLERFDVFAADAVVVVQTDEGARVQSPAEVEMGFFRTPAGSATSGFLSVSPFGIYGIIRTPTTQFILSTGAANSGLPLVIADASVFDGPLPVEGVWCSVEGEEWYGPDYPPMAGGVENGVGGCRRVRLAIETDNEYLSNLFGGSTAAATAYVGSLIGAVSEVYVRDVAVTLEVSFLRLWTTTDPWSQNSTSSQLYQFQDEWVENQGGVSRNLTHFLSGRGLGGGVAYLGVVCSNSYGYGLSANLNGSFPYPIQNNNGANWDLMVVSHELGHNFGAPHTHNMSPPVDCCGGAYGGPECGGVQNCTGANQGTIMGYCHVCPGGMSNVRMEFHPRTVVETILPYLAQPSVGNCIAVQPTITITDHPDSRSVSAGSSVSFTCAASGPAGFLYQWRRNGTNLANSAHRSGTTTPTMTINPVSAADAGSYDCVINSLCGNVAATTAATLTVLPAGGCPGGRGDANCNGVVDFFDIDPFLVAIFNQSSYLGTHCGGSLCAADADCNDVVDFFDIDPFLTCLFSGCANCP